MNKIQQITTFNHKGETATLVLWHKTYVDGHDDYEIEVLYSDAPTYKVMICNHKDNAYNKYNYLKDFYKDFYKA